MLYIFVMNGLICGGLKILKFCSGAQVQGIFRPRRSGFKGLNKNGSETVFLLKKDCFYFIEKIKILKTD